MVKARSPTKAAAVAKRESADFMLLSFEGSDFDVLVARLGNELEIRVSERGVHLPVEVSDERRSRWIAAVDDREFAGERLVTLVDPDLPVSIAFAEGIVIRCGAIDRRSAHLVGR